MEERGQRKEGTRRGTSDHLPALICHIRKPENTTSVSAFFLFPKESSRIQYIMGGGLFGCGRQRKRYLEVPPRCSPCVSP